MNNTENYLILDTETTGLGTTDEIIELGIINMNGEVIYHSMFKPNCPINPKAEEIHGISLSSLQDAPKFSDQWHTIKNILFGKKVLIYNATFDLRMLNQTARLYGFDNLLTKFDTHCIMKSYAKYNGVINPKTGNYCWVKLEQALINEGIPSKQRHRATDDCLMTLALINKVGRIW